MVKFEAKFPTKNKFEKDVLKALKEEIEKKLRHIQCPEHHTYPTVIATGSIKNIEFKIEGCCQNLIDQVLKILQ